MDKTNETLSDHELIQELSKEGAQDAIRYLYRNHYEPLSWFIMQNGGNAEDAQDIFQEVIVAFVNLVRQGRFRGESSIKTFLFAMNRNLWFNELKKRGRSAERERNYGRDGEQTSEPIERTIEQREANAQLVKLMESLGENCKKILLLFYYQNLPMKEIVKELDYENEQVVRNKKYKCLKKLEEMISTNTSLAQQLKTILRS